jgi:hypothetical protein
MTTTACMSGRFGLLRLIMRVVATAVALTTVIGGTVTVANAAEDGTSSWFSPSSASPGGTSVHESPVAAFMRGVRALPVGPCPLAPLAICERLNYVVIEEEVRARDAAEACARLPTGRRLLCAFKSNALLAMSRAVNWGDAAFPREARVVPLFGKAHRASRAASYDHALASLCDLRMNKMCGRVVEQRFEHAAKQSEMTNECKIAEALAEQWELQRELCDAKALHIQTEKEAMDKELFELEEEYAKKFGKKTSRDKDLNKMAKSGKAPPSLNCRKKEFGDKPSNDDLIIESLRETRLKLIKTRADGGYCNKDAVDKIVNSKTESNRVKAMKNIALPGEYFEECEAVLKHLDFMINLLDLQRKAQFESQGKQYRPWCDELDDFGVTSFSKDGKTSKAEDAEYSKRRKAMMTHAAEISRKRAKYEQKQLEMMQNLKEQCTNELNAAQRTYVQALEKCEAHGPRLRLLREDIIATETKVEKLVPALDQAISAVAIMGATPEAAEQLATAVTLAELAGVTPDRSVEDLMRKFGKKPLETLRQVCAESTIMGAAGGKKGSTTSCPEFEPPGPLTCAQSCAAMEAAGIGRVARRDKPFALGVIAGIAVGYILFAKFQAHEVALSVEKPKRE